MNIRSAIDADIPRIIAMGRLFWSQTAYAEVPFCPDSIAESAREMMAQGLLIVAEIDGRVIGALGCVIGPLYANRSVLVSSELYWYIEPERRRSGAGKQMIAEMQQRAALRNVKFFCMMLLEAVEPDRAAAIYKQLGFEPAERTVMKVLAGTYGGCHSAGGGNGSIERIRRESIPSSGT